MPFYVMQIQTGKEKNYLQAVKLPPPGEEARIIWPRKIMRIRKAGKWKNVEQPIFPGYLFIEAEEILLPLFTRLRRIKGFIRYLDSNQNIRPLSEEDKNLLLHFLSFGEVVGKSRVIFDENNKIKVTSGPLMGLEGCIVKVNKRKKRAKVILNLYRNSFQIDFGFELLEDITAAQAQGASKP